MWDARLRLYRGSSRKTVFALGKPLLEAERLHGIERSHLDYHLKLLVEAKLIEAVEKPGTAYGWYVRRLTCDGHEFLDTIRDPEIWAKTKAGASASGAWSIGLLKDIGAAYVKDEGKGSARLRNRLIGSLFTPSRYTLGYVYVWNCMGLDY